MKTKKVPRKLQLNKQTVANLDRNVMSNVRGGIGITILIEIIAETLLPVELGSESCPYEGCGSDACDTTNQCGTSACI